MEKINGKYTIEQATDIQRFIDEQSISYVDCVEGEPALLVFNDISWEEDYPCECINDNDYKGLVNIYLCTKIDNMEVKRLIEKLEYIKREFNEGIFNAISIKPLKVVSKEEVDNTLFYETFNNGIEDYLLFTGFVDKKYNSYPVLGKRQ